MSSYLWISGSIQPDTTRQVGRGRLPLFAAVAVLIAIVSAVVVVRTRALPGGHPSPTAATITPADRGE